MPGLKVPTSFTAGRKLTINGVTYQPGDVVPNEEVKSVKRLSSLLSRRYLIPNADLHDRRLPLTRGTRPSKLPPSAVRGL